MASSLYGWRWRKERAAYLREHPLCIVCGARDLVVEATIVDHITPHRGDLALFWDRSNWQALCKPCHDSWKQALERGHFRAGAGLDGKPTDPRHHWNR